jgi:hypothetical protein
MFLCFYPPSATLAGNRVVGIFMVQRVSTVAFEDIDARAVGVQVQVAPATSR